VDRKTADEFVAGWLRGWNAHDIDQVLSHFSEDVVFTSPVAVQLLEGSDGTIRGKKALREYWTEGLRRVPLLHFEVVGVYVGVTSVVINYRNQKGGLVNEVLIFDGDLVRSGHGTYLGDDTNLAGATQT
jgi:ketosteroid isomerase-like protein